VFRWFLSCTSSDLRVEVVRDAPLIIGRAPDARIALPPDDDTASRYHAGCQLVADHLVVRDLGSRNGTFVNDQAIQSARLSPGDIVRVGRLAYRVERVALEPEEEREPRKPITPTWADRTAPGATYRCHTCGARGVTPSKAFEGEPLLPWICQLCADERRTTPEAWPERVSPTIGSWSLLRFLGHGGMSVVFEARHRTEGLHAAIKLLRSATDLGEMGRRRFVREQRILTALRHPSVVRAFDVGEGEGELYIASELVPEGDADAIASPCSSMEAVWVLAADLFAAIAYAHGQGVVHRDIKPGNLLLTRATDPERRLRGKLSDFGLGKSLHDGGGSYRTADDEIAGTAQFMPPEQALGLAGAGVSADIYSAAATIYYLLTKELPLASAHGGRVTGFAQLCVAALMNDRVPLRQRRPEVPDDVAMWIDLLVCREPERRAHVSAQMVAERFAARAGLR